MLRVSTKVNQGHAELWQAIQTVPSRRQSATAARLLLQAALAWLEQRFHAAELRGDPEMLKLGQAWQRGETPTADAIRMLLNKMA